MANRAGHMPILSDSAWSTMMFCPHCRRDVAPKAKIDWEATISQMGLGLVFFLVVSAFLTLGASMLVGLLWLGYTKGRYKYCPSCYTPLTKPDPVIQLNSGLSDQVGSTDPTLTKREE